MKHTSRNRMLLWVFPIMIAAVSCFFFFIANDRESIRSPAPEKLEIESVPSPTESEKEMSGEAALAEESYQRISPTNFLEQNPDLFLFRGKVFDERSGQVIQKFKVTIYRKASDKNDEKWKPWNLPTKVEDPVGEFEIYCVAPGGFEYKAVAWARGYFRGSSKALDAGKTRASSNLQIRLQPLPYISGCVYDVRSGLPVEGAAVYSVTDCGGKAASADAVKEISHVTTDSKGTYALKLFSPDTHDLAVFHEDYCEAEALDIPPDSSIDFPLDAGCSISGIAYDPHCKPVEGGTVSFTAIRDTGDASRSYEAATGKGGAFKSPRIPPGFYEVQLVSVPGFDDGSHFYGMEKVTVSGEVNDVKVGMWIDEAAFMGKVYVGDKPYAGLRVRGNTHHVVVDVRGRFHFCGLEPGKLRIEFAHPESVNPWSSGSGVRGRVYSIDVEAFRENYRSFRITTDGVEGRLVHARSGKPVTGTANRGYLYRVSPQDGSLSHMRTFKIDNDGAFRIASLYEGAYECVFSVAGCTLERAPFYLHKGGTHEMCVEMKSCGKVLADVHCDSLVDPADIRFFIDSEDKEAIHLDPSWIRRNHTGRFVIDRLFPGEFTLICSYKGHQREETLSVLPGDTREVDFFMPAPIRVEGAVMCHGMPMPQVTVVFSESKIRPYSRDPFRNACPARTDSFGHYTLDLPNACERHGMDAWGGSYYISLYSGFNSKIPFLGSDYVVIDRGPFTLNLDASSFRVTLKLLDADTRKPVQGIATFFLQGEQQHRILHDDGSIHFRILSTMVDPIPITVYTKRGYAREIKFEADPRPFLLEEVKWKDVHLAKGWSEARLELPDSRPRGSLEWSFGDLGAKRAIWEIEPVKLHTMAYSIKGLSPGDHDISVKYYCSKRKRTVRARARVKVKEGQTVEAQMQID